MNNSGKRKEKRMGYLSPLGAWALAFGCAVGWGAFVMPGTTFLPVAGPVGTMIGIAVGGLVMIIIAVNYHYLMNFYPDAGGTYSFTKKIFGYDNGFLCAWFILLTYIAILWANATALPLITKNLFGTLFQFGWHYEIAGYTIYCGEVLLALAALGISALFCLRRKLAEHVQIIMAILLIAGIAVTLISAFGSQKIGPDPLKPAYASQEKALEGIFTIIALAPWAYVGFESVCHSAGEFSFSAKKSFGIMAAAVTAAAFAYAALTGLAVTVLPEGCSSWPEYISHLGSYQGIQGLPTFFAAESLLGTFGTVVLGITTLGAIMTGLIGNYIAASRLLFALAEDHMMPESFGKLDKNGVPKNAVLFILCVSVFMPFLGRTAISWIIDVTTVGATIAYAYVSACAFKRAKEENNKPVLAVGIVGFLISVLFVLYFLIPSLLAVDTLSMESYLILSAWGILGLVYFLYLFRKDSERRLGRSMISWIIMIVLIVFTASVWMRQSSESAAKQALDLSQSAVVHEFAAAELPSDLDLRIQNGHEEVMKKISTALKKDNLIFVGLIAAALSLLFMIFSVMLRREKQIEAEKVMAEEMSRAKTSFLSNMSHEIRTPINAVIGLDNIALKDPNLPPNTREQLEKIGASAKHLLGLINDILDMSRIESGRMVLKEEEFPFRDFLDQINIIINGQCQDKGLNYECRISGHLSDYYIGDAMKLKQVLINILGNAVKFTNEGGTVSFTVEETDAFDDSRVLRFTMADNGIGMSKEFIPKIFEAFSQEDTHSANKYGSTGLGMAITNNLVRMMNGGIEVESEKGVGTTFIVTVTLKSSARTINHDYPDDLPADMRVLVVDDDDVACDHALLVAKTLGITADKSLSGEDALGRIIRKREEGRPYQIVLTDCKMPGMDGIAFTKALRAFDNGETGVIIMTGYSWDDMKDEAKAAGADGFISKPLFTDSFAAELHKVLRKHDIPGAVKPQEPSAEETGSVNSIEGLHVLIAEDMDINAEILTDLLEMEGVSVDRAENGQEAVDMFAEHPENTYDAILMDVRMPVMDGLTATKLIRESDRADAALIPIIAMTANAFDDDIQRSLQAGMTAHLTKPVEPDRLFETLGRLVRRKE